MGKHVYQPKIDTTSPILYTELDNGKGYLDLQISKNKNGKAIRLTNKSGERVFISVAKVDEFIKDLQEVKHRGVASSVNDVPPFANAA